MKIIGLTGGIGTGKSTASKYLKEKGYCHIDADEISRSLTAKGSHLLPEIDRNFGPAAPMGEKNIVIINEDGTLNRKNLAKLVFTDKKKKSVLEELMFNEIFRRIDDAIEECKKTNAKGIILDVPLLFESGLEKKCDTTLLIVADEEKRIERVCARDGITAEDVRNRINSQLSDEEKKDKADIVIDNSGNETELFEKLDAITINL